eukprot:TRINITY_DN32987_c0_g1_i1.p1 TRINITY_DN32987_c0_g1~~TRINITY_DN32987_c0_g1_i1.p1  ORF type:complete len:296 (+),score=23.91 TRINITY_DN32987_c0_g1_i1:94-981(+)
MTTRRDLVDHFDRGVLGKERLEIVRFQKEREKLGIPIADTTSVLPDAIKSGTRPSKVRSLASLGTASAADNDAAMNAHRGLLGAVMVTRQAQADAAATAERPPTTRGAARRARRAAVRANASSAEAGAASAGSVGIAERPAADISRPAAAALVGDATRMCPSVCSPPEAGDAPPPMPDAPTIAEPSAPVAAKAPAPSSPPLSENVSSRPREPTEKRSRDEVSDCGDGDGAATGSGDEPCEKRQRLPESPTPVGGTAAIPADAAAGDVGPDDAEPSTGHASRGTDPVGDAEVLREE